MNLELNVELLPKQAEYVLSESSIAIYHGGVGGGKTISNVVMAIKWALENPGIDILMAAPTYGMLRDTVMREFRERCPRILLQKFNTGIYPEAVFIPIKGKSSTIRFRAFDDAGKPKGITIGGAIVDEITEMKEEILDEIMRRIRQDGMPNYLRLSTNPDSKEHYVYKRFIEPAITEKVPKSYIHSIHTTSFDNIYLPENYIENLRRLQSVLPGQYLRSVMGEWGDFYEDCIGAFPTAPAFQTPYRIAFIDGTYSDKAKSDMTALSIVEFVPQVGKENNYWPINFTGKRWQKSISDPAVVDDMLNFLNIHKPIEVCLESQLSDSTKLIFDFFREREKVLNISPRNEWTYLHQTKNKHERIMLKVAANKDRIHVLEGTQPEYLNRVISYKKNVEHEDEIDSLAGAIDLWLTSKKLRNYIQLAGKMR